MSRVRRASKRLRNTFGSTLVGVDINSFDGAKYSNFLENCRYTFYEYSKQAY